MTISHKISARIALFLLFAGLSKSGFGQRFYQDVDIAPLLESCNDFEYYEEIVACTQEEMLQRFIGKVDAKYCRNLDSTNHYSVNFEIDASGNIGNPRVHSSGKDSLCIDYFLAKAEIFSEFQKMTPAIKDKQAVAFRKQMSFYWPPIDSFPDTDTDTANYAQFVEQQPRFNACEEMIGTAEDKKQCATTRMLQFIYSNLNYPALARNNGTEGMVVASFIIDTTGFLDNIEIVRDIGDDCGQAVLTVIEKLQTLQPPFIPGRKNGEAVRVKYTIPVRFKLESNNRKRRR